MKRFNLRKARKEFNLTQDKLGEIVGSQKASISSAENGRIPVPKKWIEKMEIHFNKDLSGFFEVSTKNTDLGEVFITLNDEMRDMATMKRSAFESIPIFSQGEFAVQLKSMTMYSKFERGDWIVLKEVKNMNDIIFGSPYFIVTKENNNKLFYYLKRDGQKRDDRFLLVPENTDQYEHRTILKEEILKTYCIVGSFKAH